MRDLGALMAILWVVPEISLRTKVKSTQKLPLRLYLFISVAKIEDVLAPVSSFTFTINFLSPKLIFSTQPAITLPGVSLPGNAIELVKSSNIMLNILNQCFMRVFVSVVKVGGHTCIKNFGGIFMRG